MYKVINPGSNLNLNNMPNAEEKFNLIVKGLQEVIGERELVEILQNRNLKLYWGTATTGKPHVGYLNPLLKIAHFLKAQCDVTILFADLHAYLDAMKSSWEQLDYRTKYYEAIIKEILKTLGVSVENIRFVRGTDYQLSQKYTLDVYKLMSKMSLHDAMKAGAEVVKQSKNPKMSSLLYPGLQALDEEYLNVDAQFGGVDQRKIFMLSDKYLPNLKYKKRIHLMNPMIPSLTSGAENVKMSSSEIDTKIDFLDTPKKIKKKINKAYCKEGEIDCGLFKFIELVMFPVLKLKNEEFIINRDEKYGGKLQFKRYSEVVESFQNLELHPVDLKQGVSEWLIELLRPVRELFETPEMKDIIKKAY